MDRDQDQQEARQAGERLVAAHSSEDPFAAAFKATRMPMIITDPNQPDNPIIFCNGAFERLTGYSNDELIGRNCRILQGPGTSRETVAAVRDALAGGRGVSVDILNYKKDYRTPVRSLVAQLARHIADEDSAILCILYFKHFD